MSQFTSLTSDIAGCAIGTFLFQVDSKRDLIEPRLTSINSFFFKYLKTKLREILFTKFLVALIVRSFSVALNGPVRIVSKMIFPRLVKRTVSQNTLVKDRAVTKCCAH